jgi:hypothetical protein
MANTIKAQIFFSFQGKHYSPELEINLDQVLEAGQDFSRLHEQLAQANGIDTYSYEFEVMESCDIEFSNATGLATEFLSNSGQFDLEGFSQALNSNQTQQNLLKLAQAHMQIDSLDEIEGLQAALEAAFLAGAQSRHK